MKRIISMMLCALMTVSVFAITAEAQSYQPEVTENYISFDFNQVTGGIVNRVPNATVKVKNANEVGSNKSGHFSLKLRGNKFYLEQVLKKGYILVDNDQLSREYTVSPDTFRILLTTPEEQLKTEVANERRLRRTLRRQLQQREDEIEELYATQKILEEERDRALSELYASQADNEKLIKEMVERYSRIDFDQLDDFNRLISEYILGGELLKADSMLNSKGDIHSRIEKYRTHRLLNEEERAELDEREKALAKSEELARKELEDLAADCYRKFELFKMQHMNDSAAYYIELRAGLDTMNAEWSIDAGLFLMEYLAEYDRALSNFNSALNSAIAKHGERHPDVATSYNNIGSIYDSMGDYSKALEYYTKSLEIYLEIFGEYHIDVVSSYNRIILVYCSQGDYSKAMECLVKVRDILSELLPSDHPDLKTVQDNIELLESMIGD